MAMMHLFIFFFSDKSSFEHGLVNHALCAAMRTLLKVIITVLLIKRILSVILIVSSALFPVLNFLNFKGHALVIKIEKVVSCDHFLNQKICLC